MPHAIEMVHHKPVDVRLTAFGPFPIMLANDLRAIPQDVRYLLERSALLQQSCRQGRYDGSDVHERSSRRIS